MPVSMHFLEGYGLVDTQLPVSQLGRFSVGFTSSRLTFHDSMSRFESMRYRSLTREDVRREVSGNVTLKLYCSMIASRVRGEV